MNRPARLLTAALTASAALLLTACGSEGGGGSSPDRIKGADTGDATATANSSDSAAARHGAKRPVITLSKEFQANFEGWSNSDPKLQAILDDGREELRAKYAAIIEANPNSEAVAFYSSGTTLPSARKWIKQFTDTDDSIIGTVRVFQPQPLISDAGSGVLFYCVDERKASTKNRRTGKIVRTPDRPESLVQYRIHLDETSEGVWKTTSLATVPGACS